MSVRGGVARAMSIEENKRIIQAFFEASNHGDMDTCIGLLADDVTWTNIGSTKYSGTFAGKDVLLANLVGPLFSRLKAGIFSTIDNVVAEGEFVVVQSRGQAETTDGQPYNNTYCHVFRVRDGKISEVAEYMDTGLVNSVFGQ